MSGLGSTAKKDLAEIREERRISVASSALSTVLVSLVLSLTIAADARHLPAGAPMNSAQIACVNCPPMVRVPGLPSSPDAIVKPLYAARHELTWREYLQAVREAGCPMPMIDDTEHYRLDAKLDDSHPVTSIPIAQFDCYLGWISRKTGLRYRLPTGPEWEHIARAGSVGNYPWGNQLGQGHAIVAGHYDLAKFRTQRGDVAYDVRSPVFSAVVLPVELLPANAWGLFDTIGNASEATSEIIAGPASCLKRQSREWCRLIAGRGGDGFATDAATLIVDKQWWFSGAPNSALGFRLIHD